MRAPCLALALAFALPACATCPGHPAVVAAPRAAAAAEPPPPPPTEPPAPAPPPAPTPPPPPPSLASRLGGAAGLGRLVHATLERVGRDRRVARMLRGPNRQDVEARMTALFCLATGGTDCPAGAPVLEAAHWGERVTDREFDAFLEDLSAAMAELAIGDVEQNELLAVVGPLRARVVAPLPVDRPGHGR